MTSTPPRGPLAVALVDGDVARLRDASRVLMSFYRVAVFSNTNRAMEGLVAENAGVIVIDEMAPPKGGRILLAEIHRHPKLTGVPVIFTAAEAGEVEAKALEMGADLFLRRPYKPRTLIRAVSGLSNRVVEARWDDLPQQHRDALRKTVDAFNGISDLIEHGETLDYASVNHACSPLVDAVTNHDYRTILDGVRDHDNYSYVHSLRVATFLSLFGQTIGLRGDDLLVLASGGLVHDIGKMSIPFDVLNKPGRLEGQEWEVMKSHVARTVAYLKDHAHVPHAVMTIAEQHHEKLDGSGYPHQVKGAALDELARMASIVDVFGALTDRRVYKPPMPPEKALGIMSREMGAELDQHLLGLFSEMLLDAVHA